MSVENETRPEEYGAAGKALEEAFSNESDIFPAPEESPTPAAKRARRRAAPWWAWLLFLLILIAAAGVGVTSWQYQDLFYPNTTICGVDVSSLSLADAEEALSRAAESVTVTLRETDGPDIVTMPLTACVSRQTLDAAAADCFARQHAGDDFFQWLERQEYSFDPAISAETGISRLLALLGDALYGDTPRVHPRDAYIELSDTGYALVPEEEGNLVDLRGCAEALASALADLRDLTVGEISAAGEDLRILPEITADNRKLQRRCEVMDAYMATPVSVDFQNGTVYTLTPEDIWSVSDVEMTRTSAKCRPDPARTAELAARLAEEYGDDGVYAKFRSVVPTRELIYYRVGDKGWIMDKAELGDQVCRLLSGGQGGTAVPTYDYTWYWDGYYNCGDTFVEISLDNQYMWYFLDGKLLVETPVVTGDLATNHGTHTGFYRIVWMREDATLVGPTWNDHVDYWMPFDIPHEIGLHDSSWRDEYGGDIYITNGSHGCVNTPLEAMGTIFNNIWEGVPVIVY